MYLYAEKYVSGYEFDGNKEKGKYEELVANFDMAPYVDPATPSATISFTVAYWRKSNQIHSWFVSECQDGRDECQRSWVPREKLEELRGLCQEILDLPTEEAEAVYHTLVPEATGSPLQEKREMMKTLTPESQRKAEEILATQDGFFFGSTEYDAWYLMDIKDTVEQLDRVLSMPNNVEFYYRSSW